MPRGDRRRRSAARAARASGRAPTDCASARTPSSRSTSPSRTRRSSSCRRSTAPADRAVRRRRRRTAARSRRACATPAVVAMPRVQMLSLMATGTPSSGRSATVAPRDRARRRGPAPAPAPRAKRVDRAIGARRSASSAARQISTAEARPDARPRGSRGNRDEHRHQPITRGTLKRPASGVGVGCCRERLVARQRRAGRVVRAHRRRQCRGMRRRLDAGRVDPLHLFGVPRMPATWRAKRSCLGRVELEPGETRDALEVLAGEIRGIARMLSPTSCGREWAG